VSSLTEHERDFACYLRGFAKREDRAALAALRRGLGKRPGEVSEPSRYVDPYLSDNPTPAEEQEHYLVAALFGLHPKPWEESSAGTAGGRHWRNFGASLALLVNDPSESQDQAQREGRLAAVERRFIALLNSHRDELPEHLRHLVGLLKAGNKPVDWGQLLHDIQRWDLPSQRVRREWALAFWRPMGKKPSQTDLNGANLFS